MKAVMKLCSKQETLLQLQEEDIKRLSKGEQTSVFFWRYFPLTVTKLFVVPIQLRHPWPTTTRSSFSSLIKHFYEKLDLCLQIINDQNISFGFSRFTTIS